MTSDSLYYGGHSKLSGSQNEESKHNSYTQCILLPVSGTDAGCFIIYGRGEYFSRRVMTSDSPYYGGHSKLSGSQNEESKYHSYTMDYENLLSIFLYIMIYFIQVKNLTL